MYNKLLVIDDSPIDLYVCERFVKQYDFAKEVETLDSGRKALEYLKNVRETQSAWPDIIFLDINMPEMGGFEFLDAFDQLFAQSKPPLQIVILSSSNDSKDRNMAEQSPHVWQFLNKPLNGDKLEMIDKVGA